VQLEYVLAGEQVARENRARGRVEQFAAAAAEAAWRATRVGSSPMVARDFGNPWSRNAHDADSTPPRRSGCGNDGVGG
jgi:hypothetical protein